MDITFSVVPKSGSLFEKDGTNIGGGVDEFLSEFIQRWKATSKVVKTASNGALGTTFLVQEIDNRLLASATSVVDRVLFVVAALSEEFDSRVGFDIVHHRDRFVMAGVRIHVGENAVLLVLEIVGDFLKDRF